MSDATYSDYDITIPPGRTTGQITLICPKCAHNRKGQHQKLKTLSVNLDEGVWNCHHCNETGSLRSGWSSDPKTLPITPKAKAPQQFYPEPVWNFGLKDAIINPPDIKLNTPGDFEITWYMRNLHGKLTAAKRMKYHWDGQNFKRDRNDTPLFLNRRDAGYYSCLYLEHDLTTYPTSTVFLVESEKTAAMLRYKFKDYLESYIFLASGGSKNLTEDKYHVLKNRKVLITYDCDPPGRDGATDAYNKIKSICTAKVVDLDPSLADGTDLADILEIVDLDYLKNLENQVPSSLQDLWNQAIVSTEPPPDTPIIQIQDVTVCSIGEHSLVVGKKKSRKSLFIIQLIHWAIQYRNIKPSEIHIYDTEQGRRHVFLMREKIKTITGFYVDTFTMRGMNYIQRKELIEQTVLYWKTKPKLIIIDGIRDLMSNINDADESTALIAWIEKIIVSNPIHIINVLHLNKTDGNARGHIGTELANKAQTIFQLTINKAGDTDVECEASRDKPFHKFAFTHSPEGLPLLVDLPIVGAAISSDDRKKLLESVFEDGPMNYTTLRDEIKLTFKVSKNSAEQLIREFNRNGWIIKSGKRGDKTTVYKLITSSNGHHPEPVQSEIFNQQATDDMPF